MHKHISKRAVAALLAAVMILSAFGMYSCAADSATVLEYEGMRVTENMYNYWLCSYKRIFKNTFADYANNTAFWNAKMEDGRTREAYLSDLVEENITLTLVAASKFDSLHGRLTDAQSAAIDERINDYIYEYADGSKKAFNAFLADYGVNVTILREIFIMEAKAAALLDLLYGDSGTMPVTEKDKTAYYEATYARILLIHINDKFDYVTDEEGRYYTDENGYYVTEELSDKEKAEKQANIAAVVAGLEGGTDFAVLYEKYSEDKNYPAGYYMTDSMSFIPEVVSAAMELEENDWCKVESEYGTHIIMRRPLDEGGYEKKENADFFKDFDSAVKNDLFTKYVKQFIPDVTANDELISQFRLSKVPVCPIY